ncbi:MAG: C39 family peptidase [Terrisporobacter sp.]
MIFKGEKLTTKVATMILIMVVVIDVCSVNIVRALAASTETEKGEVTNIDKTKERCNKDITHVKEEHKETNEEELREEYKEQPKVSEKEEHKEQKEIHKDKPKVIDKEEHKKINKEEHKEQHKENSNKELHIKYYAQDDKEYGKTVYTNSRMNDKAQTISNSACGPSAYSIVVSTLNNVDVAPPELCKYSIAIGTRTDNSGTDRRFFSIAANDPDNPKYNLNYKRASSISEVKALLDDNKHLVIANMGPGHVTRQGHYIVLAGHTVIDGEVYFKVYDPHCCNQYYIYDGTIIDTVKDDGFILLKQRVIEDESRAYFVFSSSNNLEPTGSINK